jgi:hypothetical protein
MKKAGTRPWVGRPTLGNNSSFIGAPQSVPLFCLISRTIQTQSYGYRATIGGNMG